MRCTWRLRVFTTSLAGVLMLTACGGDGGSSGLTSLDPGQAGVVGAGAADQMGGFFASATQFDFSGGSGFGGFFAPASPGGRLLRLAATGAPPALRLRLAGLANLRACTPTESNPADADQDGVPDNNLITFTASNCTDVTTDSSSSTTTTVVVTGSVRIQDTEGPGDVFGYLVTITSLRISVTVQSPQGTQSVTVGVDGSFGADVASSLASVTQNLDWRFNLGGLGRYGFSTDFAASFTPDAGQVIDPTQGMFPPGDFSFDGTYRWSGSYNGADGRWSFTMVTVAPLHFDGVCDLEPPFESGAVRGEITARRTVGFEVIFQGCGVQPIVNAFDDNA